MSSSDTSEDENSAQLREALDTELIHDGMFNNTGKHTNNSNKVITVPQSKTTRQHIRNSSSQHNDSDSTANQPSLRPTFNTDDQFNMLGVTPQFQQHVAKRLSTLLEEKLQKRLSDQTEDLPRKRTKGGIKLFSTSTTRVKIGKKEAQVNRPATLSRKDEEDREKDNEVKCSEVSVSPDDILNKKDVKNWSNRSKAKVFKYRKSKTGTLTSIDD